MSITQTTQITAADVPHYALGCGLLGAGGGGPVQLGALAAEHALNTHGPVPVIDVDDVPDTGIVMPIASTGSPVVGGELVGSGGEAHALVERVEAIIGQNVVALLTSEIGGLNGLLALAWAAQTGLPLINADGMGRAFTNMSQVVMQLRGVPITPCIVTDHRGRTATIEHADAEWVSRSVVALAQASGGMIVTTEYLMRGDVARDTVIRGSVGRALSLGAALDSSDPITQLTRDGLGQELMTGVVSDVTWGEHERGATGRTGSCTLTGTGTDTGRRLRLELRDDIVLALDTGEVQAATPDLIAALSTSTRQALTTEELALGQHLTLLVLHAPDPWLTPAGLALAGPSSVGYHFTHPRAGGVA